MQWPETWHDEAACVALFEQFMPETVDELLGDLAPEGWAQSPLVRLYHPTPEQRYREALERHRQPPPFWAKDEEKGEPPRREHFQEGDDEKPVDPEREVLDLVGACLWDVFSDNNDVTGPGGKVYHLGSFRGSGGFLADFFNTHYAPDYRYGYIDFYMGAWGGSDRADLTPIYEWIFRRLYALDCDWRYHFSELLAVRFGQEEPEADDPAGYDPAQAVQNELDASQDESDTVQDEADELRESLRELNEKAKARVRRNPPPQVVQAYANVYGAWPDGWPPR